MKKSELRQIIEEEFKKYLIESKFDSEVNVYEKTIKKLSTWDYDKLQKWEEQNRISASRYINDFVIKYNKSDKEVAGFMDKIKVK